MLFVFSKLLWILIDPANLLALLLALGVLLLLISGRRRGFGLILGVTLAFVAAIPLPFGEWLIAPLEARFPKPVLPAHVDGIILLGGAVDTAVSEAHGEVALNDAAERITTTLALARHYPEAPVLISGGNSEIIQRAFTEADATAQLLVDDGLDRRRLLLEKRSRNTYDNAVYSKELAQPKPGQLWLLVTSAAHMPRAIGCFRQVGWEVLPYPVDYHTARSLVLGGFALGGNLVLTGLAAHEWVGLVAYRLLGRIGSFFPGPAAAISASISP